MAERSKAIPTGLTVGTSNGLQTRFSRVRIPARAPGHYFYICFILSVVLLFDLLGFCFVVFMCSPCVGGIVFLTSFSFMPYYAYSAL